MTLVQDRGREGFQQLGVSVSGAVDVDALDIANRLVGNDENAAGLEVMLGGLIVRFSESTTFAVTGVDTNAALDGVPVATDVSYVAHAGAELQLGMATNGLRAYLAVSGGIEPPSSLGSRSTHIASAIGGVEGRTLIEGDLLPLGEASNGSNSGRVFESESRNSSADGLDIRIVLGPQDNEFSAVGVETLLGSSYSVTDQSNRQGLRLDGPVIGSKSGRYDIISDAVVNGSIQVPGDGKPIILLADRQTTGGYAKIATVATVDLPKLGQATPGTTISFSAISVEEAQALLAERQRNIIESELPRVVVPTSVNVDGNDVSVGVAENGVAMLAEVDGDIYPISVDEYIPAD
jgi:antagonist of KipI